MTQAYTNEAWFHELQAVCQRLTKGEIARRMGVSVALVSQVSNGKYLNQRIDTFRDVFMGVFMGACVECPVVGELPRHRCLAFQQRPFCATNPTRVQLFHACRGGCEHSRIALKELTAEDV